jgi:hypothetical protein
LQHMHKNLTNASNALNMIKDVYALWKALPIPSTLIDKHFNAALEEYFFGPNVNGIIGSVSSVFERDAINAALFRSSESVTDLVEAAYTLSIVRLNLSMVYYLQGEFHRSLASAFQAAQMIQGEFFKPGNTASLC